MSHLRLGIKKSNVQYHGFADKVKDVAYDLYKHRGLLPGDCYENSPLKEHVIDSIGMSPRQIYIGIGNGLRQLDKMIWVNYLLANIHCDICLIKDLRFPEEALAIQERGGLVYKIVRDSVTRQDDGADDPLEDFERWDGVLDNNGTLGQFHDKIVHLGNNLILRINNQRAAK